MSDTAKKKGGKLRPNVIDFLIVIVIIGAVCGIALRGGVVEKIATNTSSEQARIHFLVEDISGTSYDAFVPGDDFYSKNHGCYLGKLENPSQMPAEKLIPTLEGGMSASVSPAIDVNDPNSDSYRVDVRGELVGSGVFSEEGFLVNGSTYIAPGSEFTMESKNVSVTAVIVKIEKINAG